MLALASTLDDFLLENVRDALARDQNASIRMILIGPPVSALEALFNRLTANGTADWACAAGGSSVSIPVLLVSYSRQRAVGSGRGEWQVPLGLRRHGPK